MIERFKLTDVLPVHCEVVDDAIKMTYFACGKSTTIALTRSHLEDLVASLIESTDSKVEFCVSIPALIACCILEPSLRQIGLTTANPIRRVFSS